MDERFNHRARHIVLGVDQCLLHILGGQLRASQSIATSLESLATDVRLIRQKYAGILPSEATGITVVETHEDHAVAKAQCTVLKTTPAMKAPMPHVKTTLSPGVFKLLDGGQGSFTTLGTNQAGEQVDISSVATETAVSDNPSLIVDPPAGMTVIMHPPATGIGSANVLFTATWNDGSIGPFTFTAQVSWDGGAITGITVVENP